MFYKEMVSEVFQGCVMLIVGWNQGWVDVVGVNCVVKVLWVLELFEFVEWVEKLWGIVEG